MKIRDLNQYIQKLCGEVTLSKLGENKELLLQKIYGQDPSPDQVKTVISGAASFASHAEEQLFYEFVQNAFDANADTLCFYANERYLIVLNNGEPFYTDFDIFDVNEKPRDGQLYNFLAKGKSLKRGDDKKMGKYGQGSKLLYTLLTDVNETQSNEDLLIDTIFNKKKGPYLISWDNRRQLSNLLLKQANWQPAQGDDVEENLLFAKILMSYYPMMPGVDDSLFSAAEAIEAIDAFETLVNPRRNMHYLNKGTAIIIPLGKGKYNKIASAENLERVRARLGGFASITKSQERNAGKTVSHIYVMGEEIEQHDAQSLFVEFNQEGRDFFYHFAFNPVFAQKSNVNIFKGLPILQTKFRLGFIVDSQTFEVDDSRQRINDTDKTYHQLVRAFEEVVKQLDEMKTTDFVKFDYIYKALIKTRIPGGDDSKFIKTAFEEVFKPFFEANVLTVTGEYVPMARARVNKEQSYFPLEEMGVSDYSWINESVMYYVKVEEKTLKDVLLDAEQSKLQAWIKRLSNEDYIQVHKCLEVYKSDEDVKSLKIFRSNENNLFSYEEVIAEDTNVYFPFDEQPPMGDCEYILAGFSGMDVKDYARLLFDKIKKNIEYFRSSELAVEDAVNFLFWIVDKDLGFHDEIASEILLFANRHGEYMAFEDLLACRPKDTILFDNYQINGFVPPRIETCSWLVNPQKNAVAMWQWLCRNWELLQEQEPWCEFALRNLKDILKIFEKAKESQNELDERLTLYLDEQGQPTQSERYIIRYSWVLNESEYGLLASMLPNNQKLIPYRFVKFLSRAPFESEELDFPKVIQDGIIVSKEQLAVCIKIMDNYIPNQYLDKVRTQQHGTQFKLTLKSSEKYNYLDTFDFKEGNELKQELERAGFYAVPEEVQKLLKEKPVKYYLKSNEELLKQAINLVADSIKLFPLVQDANSSVVNYFFKLLNEVDIDGPLTMSDFRWKVIDLAMTRNLVDMLFGLLRYKGDALPEEVIQQYVKVGDNQYDVYKIDDEYGISNKVFRDFLECLPKAEVERFKNNFYADRVTEVTSRDIYNRISENTLRAEQLRFCLDYANHNKCDDTFRVKDDQIIASLDMVLKYRFEGFDNHVEFPGVDFDKHIFTIRRELRNNDEELLPMVQKWIHDNPTSLSLFKRLMTESSPFVAVRKALIENVRYSDFSSFSDDDNAIRIESTIKWIMNRQLTYVFDTDNFQTVMDMIEALPDEFEEMPFLRYTGDVDKRNDKENEPKPTFKLQLYKDNSKFFSYYSWGNKFQWRLADTPELAKFFKANDIYLIGETDLLKKHNLSDCPRLYIKMVTPADKRPEFNDEVYLEWKKTRESEGFSIHISDKPISQTFTIKEGEQELFKCKMKDGQVGLDGKCVIVQYPNSQHLTVVKAIAKNIHSLEQFKEPFIALQSLILERLENGGAGEKIPEPAKKLIEGMTVEEMEKLAKEKEKVRQILEGIEEESKVRLTIGFIGELIYAEYLRRKNKEFDHAALRGVGEYDFENKTDNIFVDVKTNLYSLKDGTAPFYLHKSQNVFMQKHPNAKYHILRISLNDLSLQTTYEEIRDTYGKDANPLKDDRLRKRCEKVAKMFWEKYSIEDFDKLSPEYAIRIEKS
jgi:hypothetical protein